MESRFELSIVYADGNPRPLSRHATLTAALAAELEQVAARKGQVGHLFITDRDNEERGSLTDTDLVSCGGDYEDE